MALMLADLRKSSAQDMARTRVVEGKVFNPDGNPCANAVVYLQDEKSREVKTYVTEADGKFRFSQLSMNSDFQLWAQYQNLKSKTKGISSFSSRTDFVFELKLAPA
jgi:hypothetical protein